MSAISSITFSDGSNGAVPRPNPTPIIPPVHVGSSTAQNDIGTVVGGGETSPVAFEPRSATGAVALCPLSVLPLLTYVMLQVSVVDTCAVPPRTALGT